MLLAVPIIGIGGRGRIVPRPLFSPGVLFKGASRESDKKSHYRPILSGALRFLDGMPDSMDKSREIRTL